MISAIIRLKLCGNNGLSTNPRRRHSITSAAWYSNPFTIGSSSTSCAGSPLRFHSYRSFLYQDVGIRIIPSVPAISAVIAVAQTSVLVITADRPSPYCRTA